jgi:PKD repeat protein
MPRRAALGCVMIGFLVVSSLCLIAHPGRADWIPYATLTFAPDQTYIGVGTTFVYSLYNGRGSGIDIQNFSVHFDWQPAGWGYYVISSTVTLSSYSYHNFTLLIQMPQVTTGEHVQTVYMVGQAPGDWYSSTLTRDDTFMVSQIPPAPAVTMIAGPSSGTAPLQVSFSALTSSGSPPYQSYYWYFGDGQHTTTSGASVTHSYASAGTYTASVTVTDSYPHQGTAQTAVTVYTPLSIVASADNTSGEGSLAVRFTASAVGGVPPYSYSWVFGDGGTSSEASPTHTYASAGIYTAKLTITDSRSTTSTFETTITVSKKVGLSNLQLFIGLGSLGAVVAVGATAVFLSRKNTAQRRAPPKGQPPKQ